MGSEGGCQGKPPSQDAEQGAGGLFQIQSTGVEEGVRSKEQIPAFQMPPALTPNSAQFELPR